MITAVLEYRWNTLAVELPCRLYGLQEDLSSIGVNTRRNGSNDSGGTFSFRWEVTAYFPVGI